MAFGDSFGGVMFTIVPIFIMIIFLIVFGITIMNILKGLGKWKYNNSQPVLTVWAKVIAKRTDVTSHNHVSAGEINNHSHTYTTYYVTFEVESGDRMEFSVEDSEYGFLIEGDRGKLTFQGTRYKGFQRAIHEDI